jgi:hypothetical protein
MDRESSDARHVASTLHLLDKKGYEILYSPGGYNAPALRAELLARVLAEDEDLTGNAEQPSDRSQRKPRGKATEDRAKRKKPSMRQRRKRKE